MNAASKPAARFEDRDVHARCYQSACCRKAGKPSADDENRFHG
jgi:hypothetical protein